MPTIPVNAASPYSVHIGVELVDETAEFASRYRNVAIIYQPTVEQHASTIAERIAALGSQPHMFVVPDAEAGKTLAVAEKLWEDRSYGGIRCRK